MFKGKELKELRLAISMKGKELAEAIGKNPTYISNLENGNIVNTSYDTVMCIASVIAESDKIKSGEVDLTKYDTEFARIVMGIRYREMKEVYKYIESNKNQANFAVISKELDDEDLETFMALIKFRKLERKYNLLKENIKNDLRQHFKEASIEKVLKRLDKDSFELKFDLQLNGEALINSNIEEFTDNIIENINSNIKIGIENYITLNEFDSKDDDIGVTDGEYEVPKVEFNKEETKLL